MPAWFRPGRRAESARRVALIVAADEPALFFASREDAEQALEPTDVRAGIYRRAWDAEARPFLIHAFGEQVVISPAPGSPEPEALRAVLLRALDGRPAPGEQHAPLPDLLARCATFLRGG